MPRDSDRSDSRRHRRGTSRFEKTRDFGGAVAPSPGSQLSSLNPQLAGAPARRPLHPLERALLVSLLAHLVIVPWAIGGSILPVQLLSAFLGLCGFSLALLPRRYTSEFGAKDEFRVVPFRLLVRFPVFWLGLALFALMAVQGLNPAWAYRGTPEHWSLQPLSYRPWLPHGIAIPFNWPSDLVYAGEWRMLLIYAPVWLTVCAIWIGVTRRRGLQILLTVLAATGAALAGFGIAQRAVGATTMYGWYRPSLPSFFGPFVYKNQGGAYLLLTIGVTCGLALWYHVRGTRRLEKSSPAGVFVFFALCIAIAILTSYARGATFGMICYLTGVAVAFGWYRFRLRVAGPAPAVVIALLLTLVGFVSFGLSALHFDVAWTRLMHGLSDADGSVKARMLGNRASSQLLADHWAFGTGSGSFPFVFVPYQQRDPYFANAEFWPHAHNDILELAVEFGLPGALIIAACFAYWAKVVLRTAAWRNPLSGCLLFVAITLAAMSWEDYYFFNPAVLLTWCCLWPIAIRWAEVDSEIPKYRNE